MGHVSGTHPLKFKPERTLVFTNICKMAGIYLRDNNINKDGTGAKRSPADFRTDFKEIFPNNPQIQKETSTELGSIIIFVHDNDANLIFNQQVKAKLSAKNMSANLSSPTRLDREIYLINVPIDIYQKDIQEIKTEIVKITGYRTLEVIKFNGNNSGKKIHCAHSRQQRCT